MRALAWFLGLSTALAAGPSRITVRKVVYAIHDGERLEGALYLPKRSGRHPALIAVHGGGWQFGDARFYQHWGPYLARRGYAVLAIDYRLVEDGNHRYPAAVGDVRAAVQYLRRHADALHLDPVRLGLLGDSAGAHLAALVALAGDRAPFSGLNPEDPSAGVSTRVKVCVAIYGVYDLAAQWRISQARHPDDNICEIFLGMAPEADPARYAEASPLSQAARGDRGIAFFLAWGTADDQVPPDTQSMPFARALKEAGCVVETAPISGAAHGWAADPIRGAAPAAQLAPRLVAFLKRRL